ncbi:MAG TPA: hypothetical protein VMH32_27180 [Burkholderiales bacterium]|nr:hypothetical protein [Burkholderiales bacterium]
MLIEVGAIVLCYTVVGCEQFLKHLDSRSPLGALSAREMLISCRDGATTSLAHDYSPLRSGRRGGLRVGYVQLDGAQSQFISFKHLCTVAAARAAQQTVGLRGRCCTAVRAAHHDLENCERQYCALCTGAEACDLKGSAQQLRFDTRESADLDIHALDRLRAITCRDFRNLCEQRLANREFVHAKPSR